MNKQQQIAIRNYCRFAFETINPRFCYATPKATILLTVAAGHE